MIATFSYWIDPDAENDESEHLSDEELWRKSGWDCRVGDDASEIGHFIADRVHNHQSASWAHVIFETVDQLAQGAGHVSGYIPLGHYWHGLGNVQVLGERDDSEEGVRLAGLKEEIIAHAVARLEELKEKEKARQAQRDGWVKARAVARDEALKKVKEQAEAREFVAKYNMLPTPEMLEAPPVPLVEQVALAQDVIDAHRKHRSYAFEQVIKKHNLEAVARLGGEV